MDEHSFLLSHLSESSSSQERPRFISVSCWRGGKRSGVWGLLSWGPGNIIVPNWGMPQHIQRDGIHLFKKLHIQISLGKTASDSKLQQRGDQALASVQRPPPLMSPHQPTALTASAHSSHGPHQVLASFCSLQKQPPRLLGLCLPLQP